MRVMVMGKATDGTRNGANIDSVALEAMETTPEPLSAISGKKTGIGVDLSGAMHRGARKARSNPGFREVISDGQP